MAILAHHQQIAARVYSDERYGRAVLNHRSGHVRVIVSGERIEAHADETAFDRALRGDYARYG
jgi:hypothetical protein